MNLIHLQSFVCVVEKESFSIAAGLCNLTQSAVSQHVKAMEEDLGAKLLIRNTHSIALTESGKTLYQSAKRILKEASDCYEEISNINQCLKGELNIGVGSFIEPYIRKAAVAMMEKYPGVKLNVEFGKATRLNQLLREHKLDIAFTMNTAYVDEGIESEPCIPLRIYAVMSQTHPLASKEEVSYADIMRFPVLMPDAGERVYATIQKYMGCVLNKLKVKAVVNSSAAILNVLDELKAMTFLPKQYVAHRSDLVAIPIKELRMEMSSNVHWMKDVSMKTSAKMFMKIVREDVMPLFKVMEEVE